nr:RNA-directed DNA polymerase, eukaryota, reverse transcriptase zinc-binding domain protein [Tanacetum cinerariifolium]
IVQIKNRLLTARSRKKSYVDVRPRPLEFNVGDKVMLKKCLSDESLKISLDEVQLDDKLHFIEEPTKIMDREVKKLKQSRIPIVKVHWNSRQGPEYMWEHEDQMKSKGSVIVNGSPTKEFQFHKGLKQGDPLSPFLFILVMESLHVSFQRVVDVCLFKGIKVASSLYISHLFYADDAIFMGQWNQSNIDTITRVLEVFHRASGLSINMNKSKLMGISVDISKVKQAAMKIGCLILKTPFTYLGSRVGGLMSRIQSWNDIIESMVSRLSRWKLKTLSIGGILTLLKSVLGAILIYHMSIFKVPMKVLQNMESIRSRFFNGADINYKKPSWVRWKNVMASKDTGGLGVSSLFALNRALMFKWVWRFISQKSSLWASVIKVLHSEDGVGISLYVTTLTELPFVS